jgi:hypothetical protein
MTDDTPPFARQRATLEQFWGDLKYAVGMILSVFGSPSDIAAYKMMLARTRQEILIWLAPVEAMARRILLLAALTAQPPNLPERRRRPDPPVESALRDAPFHELSDHSADWRVLFNNWPHAGGQPRENTGRRPVLKRFTDYNAYPLARRVEALVRLARDPAAAIRRMAMKIALRRGQLRLAFARYRHDGGPVQALLDDVQAHVDAALWNTS